MFWKHSFLVPKSSWCVIINFPFYRYYRIPLLMQTFSNCCPIFFTNFVKRTQKFDDFQEKKYSNWIQGTCFHVRFTIIRTFNTFYTICESSQLEAKTYTSPSHQAFGKVTKLKMADIHQLSPQISVWHSDTHRLKA